MNIIHTVILRLAAVLDPEGDKEFVRQNEFLKLRAAAEKGEADAQHKLGVYYRSGENGEKNAVEAAKWYRKAAEQGDAVAQYFLGIYYGNGDGVEKNAAEAAKWCLKAAEQGYSLAQGSIGHRYYFGDGVERDYVAAAYWWRQAAEQGYFSAQHSLGCCYRDGDGVEKDLLEAYAWNRVASAGDPDGRRACRAAEKVWSAAEIAAGEKRAEELRVQIELGIAARRPPGGAPSTPPATNL